jgi:tetratricopeptide (TPR) repeat protein
VAAAERAAIWSALGDLRYLFQHSLLRDAAYSMQLQARREALHALAAQGLAALYAADLDSHYGELGFHAERAGQKSQAADWYVRAGERARRQGLTQEAHAYFQRALEVAPADDLALQWRALYGRCTVLDTLGDAEGSQKDAQALLELADRQADAGLEARAHYLIGSFAHSRGDDHAALEALDRALEKAAAAGDLTTEAMALGIKVICLARLGDVSRAGLVGERAVAAAESLGDEEIIARSLVNVAFLHAAAGDHGQAVALLARLIAQVQGQGNLFLRANGLTNLAYNQMQLGQYAAALSNFAEALRLAEAIGSVRLRGYNSLNLSLAQWRTGGLAEAQACLDEARPLLRQAGDLFADAVADTYQGLILEAAGCHPEAADAFAAAAGQLKERGAEGYAADALAGGVRCRLALGQVAAAGQEAAALWRYLEASGASGLELPSLAYLSCADALAAQGAGAEAVVRAAHADLNERAGRIADPAGRACYLEEVPEHRRTLALWAALSA